MRQKKLPPLLASGLVSLKVTSTHTKSLGVKKLHLYKIILVVQFFLLTSFENEK